MSKKRKAVFLDRDGLLNRQAAPHHYIHRREDFIFLPGVPGAVRRLNEAGYLVIVVTNQRGVARGMLTMAEVEDVHAYMRDELRKWNAHIDGIYICPHEVGECRCRKPDIGLFLMAERDFPIDKEKSWMVGDSGTDVEAGMRYGVRTLMSSQLPQAVETILKVDEGKIGT